MNSQFPFGSPFPITPSEAAQLSNVLHHARSSVVSANLMGTITLATDAEIARIIKQSHALIRATRALLMTMPTHRLGSHEPEADETFSSTG